MYDDVNAEKMIFVFFGQTTGDFPNGSKTIFKKSYLFNCLLLLCF